LEVILVHGTIGVEILAMFCYKNEFAKVVVDAFKFVLDAFYEGLLSARKMLDPVTGSPERTLATIVRHRV
jgi:hypothetical protein